MENGLQLFADSSHGIYIPQHFAEAVQRTMIVDAEKWNDDLNILENGPENGDYREAWGSVRDAMELKDAEGNVWKLYQDGDLWLVCYKLMTFEEKRNMFGSEQHWQEC
jgi:hypothetical protein